MIIICHLQALAQSMAVRMHNPLTGHTPSIITPPSMTRGPPEDPGSSPLSEGGTPSAGLGASGAPFVQVCHLDSPEQLCTKAHCENLYSLFVLVDSTRPGYKIVHALNACNNGCTISALKDELGKIMVSADLIASSRCKALDCHGLNQTLCIPNPARYTTSNKAARFPVHMLSAAQFRSENGLQANMRAKKRRAMSSKSKSISGALCRGAWPLPGGQEAYIEPFWSRLLRQLPLSCQPTSVWKRCGWTLS